jgi:hypothetical protein
VQQQRHACMLQRHAEPAGVVPAVQVSRCLFKDVFSAEGLPAQLLGYQCCQANMMWLDVYKGYGISSSLSSSMARGDSSCCIQLALPKAK